MKIFLELYCEFVLCVNCINKGYYYYRLFE